MKTILLVTLLFCSATALADEATSPDVAKLKIMLHGKTIACKPSKNPRVEPDPAYRGDEGYFWMSITGNELVISNHGGSGYGFANGNVRDIHLGPEELFVSAGDDGHQVLVLEVADFGQQQPDCVDGRLMSYFDGFRHTDELRCCLE